MLAAAVALVATFAFPRVARGAKDDTMRVSWSPQAAACQQETGLKEYLNSDYYYRGETVDGKGYYSRDVDSALLGGKPYEMYLYAEQANFHDAFIKWVVKAAHAVPLRPWAIGLALASPTIPACICHLRGRIATSLLQTQSGMLAAAVALVAICAFPRLARGAKDDTMRVSWSPQGAACQQETELKEYLNSDYYYRGETVDGKGYYSRNVDSASLDGKQYEMYLYYGFADDADDGGAGGERWGAWAFDIYKPSLTAHEMRGRVYPIAEEVTNLDQAKPAGLGSWFVACGRPDFE
eukprot:gene5012-29836_t